MKNFINTIRDMNIANKLTLLRILLTPAFVAFLAGSTRPWHLIVALIIFIVAACTDFLDGYFARTRMMVTPLGQFLDPIADKILVMSALVTMSGMRWFSAWVVVIILARDFIVGGVRLISVQSDEKIVVPARNSGKVKTIITMLRVVVILFLWTLAAHGVITYEVEISEESIMNAPDIMLRPISNIFMYICAGLTVFSGAQYVWDARYILRDEFNKKSVSK